MRRLLPGKVVAVLGAAITLVVAAAGAGWYFNWAQSASVQAEVAEVPQLAALPVEMTVKQRSTTAVPGSDGELLLSIDDVTRGQILVTLLPKEKSPLIGPISMKPSMSMDFAWGSGRYVLQLKQLHNAMIGEDFADFVITEATTGRTSLTENEKIERLIATIHDLDRATFIRNGVEHTSTEAAAHLRQKWDAARDEIKTARDFIDKIATASSLSGVAYRIRFSDGKEIDSAEFLTQRLTEIEAAASPALAADETRNRQPGNDP